MPEVGGGLRLYQSFVSGQTSGWGWIEIEMDSLLASNWPINPHGDCLLGETLQNLARKEFCRHESWIATIWLRTPYMQYAKAKACMAQEKCGITLAKSWIVCTLIRSMRHQGIKNWFQISPLNPLVRGPVIKTGGLLLGILFDHSFGIPSELPVVLRAQARKWTSKPAVGVAWMAKGWRAETKKTNHHN